MEFTGLKRNRNYKKTIKIIIICIIVIVLLAPFLIWQNNSIVVTEYAKQNSDLKEAFNGFTIVQVSDLHSKNFKGKLLTEIAKQNPDIIVITGDLIDMSDKNFDIAERFIRQAVNIADIYFASGNHEELSSIYLQFIDMLNKYGVYILNNRQSEIIRDNESINIYGFSDSRYPIDNTISLPEADFNIVLCHRPHEPSIFSKIGADLVFAGHAHGGQVRIPLVGPLVAPDQGFFPKYTEGMRDFENTSLVISRGLGNSILPLRIFNRPELVVVKLYN